MKTALTTKELGLGLAVAPVDVTASGASLAGLSRVYHQDLASESLSFIFQKALELGKAPRMKSATGFPMIDLDAVSDVGEVFKHDSGSRFNIPDNRSGDNVVAIPSETLFAPSEASKVSLGTLRTIGLESTSEAKDSFDNFLHVFIAMKAVVGANGRASHSQIHADSFTIGNELDIWQASNYVKIEPIFAVNEVSRSRRATHRVPSIVGKCESNPHSTLRSSQVYNTFFPIQSEGMQVVARRAEYRLGTRSPAALPLSGDCRLHCFGGFLPSLNVQVRHKIGQSILTIAVCQAMKCVGVAVTLFPPHFTDSVERLGELLHCFMQSVSLFLGRLEQHSNRSIHIWIIPYTNESLQIKEVVAHSSAT